MEYYLNIAILALAGVVLTSRNALALEISSPTHQVIASQSDNQVTTNKETKMNRELIDEFKRLAASGEIENRIENNATFCLECQTFGGKIFWDTYSSNGWKLQINGISGWWRILDSKDTRRARGTTEAQLRNLLGDRPTSMVQNYRDKGYRFVKTESKYDTGRTVVLVHGWGVRANSMQKLADSLAEEGYDAYTYDYPSAKHTLPEHVAIFTEKLRELLTSLPPGQKVSVVTHSMGGLLLRGALAAMTVKECHRISSVIMLGPPNRGSILALLGKIPLVKVFNKSLDGMAPDCDSYVMNIPAPAWLPPTGIIAGDSDGKVSKANTHLPDGQPHAHIIVPCTHPGLRNPQNVLTHILDFFRKHAF